MLDEERLLRGGDYEDHGLLFCWPDGRPIYPETITDQFNRLVDRAGLAPITLHGVRHTYATMSLRAGVNPKIVSARLGHATVAFTLDTYTAERTVLPSDSATCPAATTRVYHTVTVRWPRSSRARLAPAASERRMPVVANISHIA